MNATGTWSVPDVSVGRFLGDRSEDVARLLSGIRSVCRFSDAGMAVVDELGRLRDHEVPAASLLLWSAGVTGVPEPVERLEEPALLRRMCRMAADLQLTLLLQALVTAAVAAGTGAVRGAEQIVEVLTTACALADPNGGSTPGLVFRMWRVAHLPGILRPESDAPDEGKAGYRAYDEALDQLLGVS
ncbi:hypothetical protein [Streptomyces sp. Tu 4128]|uniref:hypothetical protein n=1 Tax=unclassified Streptomyces TaxID=2593676 RepID=UPI0013CF36A5|nr:hypothetical protein [Streptomyces sp. Tu 4128]